MCWAFAGAERRCLQLWRGGRARLLLAIACGALVQLLVTWGIARLPTLQSSSPADRGTTSRPQIVDREPTLEYEQRRRNLKNGIYEFWYYMETELRKLQSLQGKDKTRATKGVKIEYILESVEERMLSLLADFTSMQTFDGYEKWREAEAAELGDLVQRRIIFLQNPPRCAKARKLVCHFARSASFEEELHHVVYCFIVAYATQRTLILKPREPDLGKEAWQEFLQPLSKKCLDANGVSHSEWPGKEETQVLYLPKRSFLYPAPPYLPPRVPADLAARLARLHGNPLAWWVGQFLKYALRPRPRTVERLQQSARQVGFEAPVVGVYISASAKPNQYEYVIAMYMEEVEKYFDSLALSNEDIQRRIFLVADDQILINRTTLIYHHYEVLQNPVNRFGSVDSTIIDIHFLSRCDYVVCAFSSHLCRAAYEIMQTLHPDAADRFHSVDDVYFYKGMHSQHQEVIYPHYSKSEEELDLRVGDQIKVTRNYWNGSSKGKLLRLSKTGLFPSFKVKVNIEAVDFPTYQQVPLKNLTS
ncbi:hypothetical protein R5R35_014369 [Gryllus longicercus]|uniref:Alpha-(1,6)-fucosyltransferase n=1 Tax=Gryllus longicercus TaxID=2509291 RepID=A0AAN9Z1Z8_9ORTH